MGIPGPAKSHSPVTVLDMRVTAGGNARIDLREGHTAAIYVLRGKVLVNGAEVAGGTELVLFEREGDHVELEAGDEDARPSWISTTERWGRCLTRPK